LAPRLKVPTTSDSARRNAALFVVYSIGQNAPLYWPYMFHLVTVTRGLSATEFGALKLLYYAVTVVLEVPFGAVADRLGRRPTLILSALLNALGCGLYAFAPGLTAFAAAELVLAASNAFHSGADAALLYDSLDADGRASDFARLYGRARGASYAALALGLPLADLLLVRGGDPSPTYLATALLALIAMFAALAMSEPAVERRHSTLAITRSALRTIRGDRGLLRVILYGAGVYMLYRAGNAAYYDPILAAKRVAVDRFGSIYAAVSVCGALSAFGAHRLKGRGGYGVLIVAMPSALLAMYAGLMLAPGSATAALFLIEGFVGGLQPIVANDLANRRAGDASQRATVLSLQSFVWRGSYAMVSLWIGWTLDAFALPLAVALGVLACSLPLVAQAALRDGRAENALGGE
jgi:MFS family permease